VRDQAIDSAKKTKAGLAEAQGGMGA